MTGLLEQAYAGFVKEVLFGKNRATPSRKFRSFLVRIYKEQFGGSHQGCHRPQAASGTDESNIIPNAERYGGISGPAPSG